MTLPRRLAVRPDRRGVAKHHGLDPFAYLRDVTARSSDHPFNRLHELLPNHWNLAAKSA